MQISDGSLSDQHSSNPEPHTLISLKSLCSSDVTYLPGHESGLGVFISYIDHQARTSFQIQATTMIASSPIHAEALSMLLGSCIIQMLKLQGCKMLSDNLPLINYIKTYEDVAPDWKLRQIKKDIFLNIRNLNVVFEYIKREENYMADVLARTSLSNNSNNSTFRCFNRNHLFCCPVKDVLHKFLASLDQVV